MIDITADIRGQAQFRKAVKALGKNVNDTRTIRKMLRPGVKPIRDAIRAATPKGDSVHYSYRKGKRVSTFLPGHLRKSTQDIADRKRAYKRVPAIYVGPVFTRKARSGGTFGATVRDVDAYYAHMVFGSAAAYEKRVINAGFNASKTEAGLRITKNAEKIIEENAKKSGFRTR